MSITSKSSGRWSIVLAGGEGERLRSWTEKRFGSHRPKQYCSFDGRQSMLEHTLDRATAASGPHRLVTVIGAGHRRFLAELASNPTGRVIEQPCRECRGTGRSRIDRSLTVKIPAGVESGTRLKLAGEGEAGVQRGDRGDL